MKTETNDYIPQPHERQKTFTLSPAADPISGIVIGTREKACQDPNLSDGAVRLFVFLLDLAMSPFCNVTRGVVVVSVTQICERIHCARRSVFSWMHMLEMGNYVWVDKQYMPNFWALNRYHIAALDPRDQPSQLPTRDGMWGNGVRRPAAPSGTGARGGGAKFATENPPEFSDLAQNAPEAGKIVHAPGATVATERRKICDGPSQKRIPGSRKKGHAGVAKNATGSGNGCTGPSQKSAPFKILDSGLGSGKHPQSLKAQQLKAPKGVVSPEEKDFLSRVGGLVGPKNLANYGGWYRNVFRENRAKAWRVHAEVARMKREGEIATNPGGCFMDLWKRFQ
jgi:hypothetical protein